MANVDYAARGFDGFACTLRTKNGLVLEVSAQDGQQNDPVGDEVLLENPALVASLNGYAVSEMSFRRSRQEEKKKSLRKQATKFERDAEAIAEYIALPGGGWVAGWCSGCFQRARHRKVLKTGQPVAVLLCQKCGTPTTPCLAPGCRHFARRGTRSLSTPRYCAEHRHEIPSFTSAEQRLGDLTEAQDWMKFTKTNFSKATKVAGLGVGVGAIVVAPLALLSAPVIGGAIGAAGGLSGAAATSHGLAVLGGGALSLVVSGWLVGRPS